METIMVVCSKGKLKKEWKLKDKLKLKTALIMNELYFQFALLVFDIPICLRKGINDMFAEPFYLNRALPF